MHQSAVLVVKLLDLVHFRVLRHQLVLALPVQLLFDLLVAQLLGLLSALTDLAAPLKMLLDLDVLLESLCHLDSGAVELELALLLVARQVVELVFRLVHREKLDGELPFLEASHLLARARGKELFDFFERASQVLLRLRRHNRRRFVVLCLHYFQEQGLVTFEHFLICQLMVAIGRHRLRGLHSNSVIRIYTTGLALVLHLRSLLRGCLAEASWRGVLVLLETLVKR